MLLVGGHMEESARQQDQSNSLKSISRSIGVSFIFLTISAQVEFYHTILSDSHFTSDSIRDVHEEGRYD
jgi:hypothetical protein